MKDLYSVVLAGGSGERLWPLSSPARPKQLIPFINGGSLLEQTIQRVQPLAHDKNHLIVVTNAEQQDAVIRLVGDRVTVMTELVGRNTAPAILLACLEIAKSNRDAVVAVIPSDHFMPDIDAFVSLVNTACKYAAHSDNIVLVGVTPTSPATGYGYIQRSLEPIKPGINFFTVEHFHEKPDLNKALHYLQQKNMLWNAGIFVGRVAVFLDQFQKQSAVLWDAMAQCRAGLISYPQLPAVSFDTAVLEKTKQCVVFPTQCVWHDVGTLAAFLSLQLRYQKDCTTKIIALESYNNLVSAHKKTVALIGVHDVCVVETDDSLLIVAQDCVERVKDVALLSKNQESARGANRCAQDDSDQSQTVV